MKLSSKNILNEVFGYPEFRGQQETIIEAALQGGDSLVIMSTGGGKSLCYQIPAMLRERTGLVISPLIALMQDQVTALHEKLASRPQPAEEMLDISGVGQTKLDRYGEGFLEVLRERLDV